MYKECKNGFSIPIFSLYTPQPCTPAKIILNSTLLLMKAIVLAESSGFTTFFTPFSTPQ